MEEVFTRLQQLELANAALQAEARRSTEVGEERYRRDRDTARHEAEETSRQVAEATRTVPLVLASVDAKLRTKLETFSGKDAEWPRWSLTLSAYLGAVVDAQLYFILIMFLKENLMEKVETVEYGEELRLWRLLATDVKPKFASRKTVLQLGIVNFHVRCKGGSPAGIGRMETQVRQYLTTTKKKIDEHLRTAANCPTIWVII